MTLDRAVLTAVWTAYTFAGSYLKDQRLVHYIGLPYREYQSRVTGFPGMLWGPLARIPLGGRESAWHETGAHADLSSGRLQAEQKPPVVPSGTPC
jgi:hypothetical protein